MFLKAELQHLKQQLKASTGTDECATTEDLPQQSLGLSLRALLQFL